MMKRQESYVLRRPDSVDGEEVKLKRQDYESLVAARAKLSETASLEEKFVAIFESFKLVEQFVFRACLEHMLYDNDIQATWQVAHSAFGRHVLSFLAIVRLYQDSLVTHVREISAGKVSEDDVKKILSDAYDSSFSYRVMEAIRNYTQHRSFPVHDSEYVTTMSGGRRHFGLEFHFKAQDVKQGDKFKRSVLAEIDRHDGRVDLAWCIRIYFAKMCDIHGTVRKLLEKYKDSAEIDVRRLQVLWEQENWEAGSSRVYAYKIIGAEPDPDAAPVSIDPNTDAYRVSLHKRTELLTDMNKRRIDMYGSDIPEDYFNQKN